MDKTKFILPGAIIIGALLISASVIYSRPQLANNGNPEAESTEPIDVNTDDGFVLGNSKAPVTVIEFGDYQCPFCKVYFENVQKNVVEEFVNTGKAKFVWMDYAFLGEESIWAAQAARCAGDQGKFWEYHDYLYSNQEKENAGDFTKDNLKSFAASLGLNPTDFNTCLDSDKHLSTIESQTQYGSSIGVNGTPATFINGIKISGAVPYSKIKAAIEEALSK